MTFFCDEGVERPVVEQLRADGHEVVYVAELDPGLSDDDVLEEARRRDAPLVTLDKDFGELVFRQGRATAGVVLLRLAGLSLASKARVVSAAVEAHASELEGAFTVVTPGTVRIRRSV